MLQPRASHEYYPTPQSHICGALDICLADIDDPVVVIDPGAGRGEWGRLIKERWPTCILVGIEFFHKPDPEVYKFYDEWLKKNYMLWKPSYPVNLIIGNPPYGDPWEQGIHIAKKKAKTNGLDWKVPKRPANLPRADAEAFIRHSIKILPLNKSGNLLFLLRLAFLESATRAYGLWAEYPPTDVWICAERPSFTGNGKTDATAYMFSRWCSEIDIDRPTVEFYGHFMRLKGNTK